LAGAARRGRRSDRSLISEGRALAILSSKTQHSQKTSPKAGISPRVASCEAPRYPDRLQAVTNSGGLRHVSRSHTPPPHSSMETHHQDRPGRRRHVRRPTCICAPTADLQRFGISGPGSARVGLDKMEQRELANVKFEARRGGHALGNVGETFAGPISRNGPVTKPARRILATRPPGEDILRDIPDLDVPRRGHAGQSATRNRSSRLLAKGVHVITEKPMCLSIQGSRRDHRRPRRRRTASSPWTCTSVYDPDHSLRVRDDNPENRIGPAALRHGRISKEAAAGRDEHLQVGRVERSRFSYVGAHWTDLIYSYYHSKPVSLTAVGQKEAARGATGSTAYDAGAGARGFRERDEHQLSQQPGSRRRTSRRPVESRPRRFVGGRRQRSRATSKNRGLPLVERRRRARARRNNHFNAGK